LTDLNTDVSDNEADLSATIEENQDEIESLTDDSQVVAQIEQQES